MRFRLRTAIASIALLGLPLACAGFVTRHSGLRSFLVFHASLANAYSFQSARCRNAIDDYWLHQPPGHSCPICRRYERPIGEMISEQQQYLRAYERAARWHAFLAGPSWLRGGRPLKLR